MESSIGLRFSTITTINLYSISMPSGFHAARATKVPQLSFIHSSLSLPKSSRNQPNDRVTAPMISMVNDSLTPTFSRVNKRESIARPSSFLGGIGWDRRINHIGNAALVDAVLPHDQPRIDHHFQLMEMVQKLKESHQYDTAVKLLKGHELNVLENLEVSYQVKMEIMHILYLQGKISEALKYAEEFYENKAIYAKRFQFDSFYATKLMEIALELKESKHYDLAVKLLKEQDPEVQDDPDASYFVKMEIMHILYLQTRVLVPDIGTYPRVGFINSQTLGFKNTDDKNPKFGLGCKEKYEEAKTYCDEIEKNEAIYRPHFKVGLFYALKSGILCGLNENEEAIKYMEKFRENRSEAIPLAPPDKDESTKHHGS